MSQFDVVGVGLNATDTLILLPKFPSYGGKIAFEEEIVSPGGQVASAMAACSRLGLRTKYIGAVGDDSHAQLQLDSLRRAGVNIDDILVRKGCSSQTAYILVDCSTGERTALWRRPSGLRLAAEEIRADWITCSRLLHIDAHDTPAVERAARIARAASIPVTLDVGSFSNGFERVLAEVDYLIGSTSFPTSWTGEEDPFKALELIQREYGMRMAAMTLGCYGALALSEGQFIYSPGFVVDCADTTGAGDIFHGAFCYAVLQEMTLPEALDFSNAMAALNCTAIGARGGISTVEQAMDLLRCGSRRSHADYRTRVTL
jgi:sulfofructose kinase